MTFPVRLSRLANFAMRRVQRIRRNARRKEIERLEARLDTETEVERDYEWVSDPALHNQLMDAMRDGWGKDAEDRRWNKE